MKLTISISLLLRIFSHTAAITTSIPTSALTPFNPAIPWFTWEQITPSNKDSLLIPAPRFDFAYAYDYTHKSIVIFGGQTQDGTCFDDTWLFDTVALSWSRPALANDNYTHPGQRTAMIYGLDQPTSMVRNNFIISMGRSLTAVFADTWAFNLTASTWSQLNISGTIPSQRYSCAGGIDINWKTTATDDSNYLLLSHGTDGSSYFTDTFVLELATTQFQLNISSIDYSIKNDSVNATYPTIYTLQNYTVPIGTWSLISNIQSKPPTPRSSMASTVYYPNTLFVQGGCDISQLGPCLSNSAFEFVLNIVKIPTVIPDPFNSTAMINSTNSVFSGIWTQSVLSSTCPGRRTRSTMSFVPDFSDSRLIFLYGGNYGDYAGPIGQLAVQDLAETWTIVQPGLLPSTLTYPFARQMTALIPVFDPTNPKTDSYEIYMFGGNLTPCNLADGSDIGYRDANDLWKLTYYPPGAALSYDVSGTQKPYSTAANCPDVLFVDPQGDGIPKIDASGAAISAEILPATTSSSQTSFIVLHGLLMLVAFGILSPFGIILLRVSNKNFNSNLSFVHGMSQTFIIILSVGTLLYLIIFFNMTVSFVFAVVSVQNLDAGTHFNGAHGWIGLILIGSVIFQGMYVFLKREEMKDASQLTLIDNDQMELEMLSPTSPMLSTRVSIENLPESIQSIPPKAQMGTMKSTADSNFSAFSEDYFTNERPSTRPITIVASPPSDADLTDSDKSATLDAGSKNESNQSSGFTTHYNSIHDLQSMHSIKLNKRIPTIENTRFLSKKAQEKETNAITGKMFHLLGWMTVIMGLVNVGIGINLTVATKKTYAGSYMGWCLSLIIFYLIADFYSWKRYRSSTIFKFLFRANYNFVGLRRTNVLSIGNVCESSIQAVGESLPESEADILLYTKGADGCYNSFGSASVSKFCQLGPKRKFV